MASATHWILLTGLLSALAVSAPVLLSRDDGTRLASAAEIRELVQAVAICPALNETVAAAFERVGARPTDGLIVEAELEDAYRELAGRLRGDEAVLLKASRGMKFERAIPLFERDFGVATASGANNRKGTGG